MTFAIDPEATWTYVLKRDQKELLATPEAEVPVFILRQIPPREHARIEDRLAAMDSDKEMHVRGGSQVRSILKAGLAGWKRFIFPGGEEAEFKETNGLATDGSIACISADDRRELSEAITDHSVVEVTFLAE